MLEQEIRNLWKNAPEEYQVSLDKTMLIFRMDKELDKMNRRITIRNIREVALNLIAYLFIIYVSNAADPLLFYIGIALSFLATLYSWYRIFATRSLVNKVDTGSSILEQLETSKNYWSSESQLLKTVHIPALLHLPGYACFIWATTIGGAIVFKLIIMLIIALLIIAGVYFMNKYAEKKSIQPLLKNIDEAIVRLKE
jgi:hypothetical protein